jgi:threonine/homoserine/homoserine lactone efflux protein
LLDGTAAMPPLPYTLSFVVASAALAIAPGPDILYVLAKGVSQGRRTALIAAAGFCSGLTVHTAASVCGLSALLVASASAFTIFKFLGAGYLVFLGVRAFCSRGMISLPADTKPMTAGKVFAQAFLMNVLNPKVALFFLAFLPQFIVPEKGHVPLQLFLLGLGFGVISFCVFSVVGFFSATLGRFIRTRPTLSRILDRIAGLAFILLGLRLALASRGFRP